MNCRIGRSQWPRGLRRRSGAARLLRFCVRIPPEAWKFFCCECCVLSGRGLCDELITCPEESYRLRSVVVCDPETSVMRRPWPIGGCRVKNKQTNRSCTLNSCSTSKNTQISSPLFIENISHFHYKDRFVKANNERLS